MHTLTSSQTANHLNSRDWGAHNLIVYHDLDTFRAVYATYCNKSLPKQQEIVVLVSNYEPIEAVRSALKMQPALIADLHKYEDNGSLVILDSVKAYQIDADGTYKLARTLAARAAKEGKKGVTVLGDMGSFFLYDRLVDILEYEKSLPFNFTVPVRGYCFYHRDDFGRLTKEQQNQLFKNHQEVVEVTKN